ncbi:hypothetical protein [Tardiphaga sp.]|uniref:hypothetical protein n=1 Tax=Tardiphaga sp. TaxID=1926292 RepID=UPI002A6981C9|nr:transcriptional regulator, LysR family [Tardiphaga sp.]
MSRLPEDLLAHGCLRFNFRRAEPAWPFRRDGRDYKIDVTGKIEANSGEAVTQLARLGVDIARDGLFSVRATSPATVWYRCSKSTIRRTAKLFTCCSSGAQPCPHGCAYSSIFSWSGWV